ncbi:hypothetical protein KP509_01G083400 [Ceratopteris richardii]|uniref:CTLH domain-containing protein n=1 Tax=Ceratopteris richardii TaxID=49495 RepID=A0A8T2VLF1_CERRI|nr:hypothetical protein KP509_01G083400 [Ceratopteris richardii]
MGMEESIFENVPVNWNALDALVLDYAENEQLLLGSEKCLESFMLRSTVNHVRGLIEQGSIDEALDLIQRHAPCVLQDQRLLFRLHKQKFIELLRAGGQQAQEEAIQCSRTVLGPCALTAYPEAYEEFKRLLLVLIYSKDDTGSPVAQEWSESNRTELAAILASVLRARFRAYDPLFSLVLRYLLSYCSRQGATSPIADLSTALMNKEKDPPAMPNDCLLEAPKFNESDVQALAYAVDLSRQGAVDSLRYAGADLKLALKNELSRIKLDIGLLDELVHDYCIYRGLIDTTTNAVSTTCSEIVNSVLEPSEEHESAVKSDMGASFKAFTVNASAQGHKLNEIEQNELWESFIQHERLMKAGKDAAMEDRGDSRSEDSNVGGLSRDDIYTAGESICSTSGQDHEYSGQTKSLPGCPRKRWAGRAMISLNGNQKSKKERHLDSDSNGQFTASKSSANISEEEGSDIDKFGLALQIRELTCEGLISEVIQKVNALNPQLFDYNPHLLFQLKQVEFLTLVESGNYMEALSIARCDMGPLAAKHTELLKPLKETILALARPRGEYMKSISLFALGTRLQAALTASLGVSEPVLMKIMKVTLHMHTELFKLQMCADPFAEMLRITSLKDTDPTSLGSVPNNIPETSTVTSKDGSGNPSCLSASSTLPSQQAESVREGPIFDETSILTVMEWMAVSRGDAIQLLAQYDGSIESVLEHLLPE